MERKEFLKRLSMSMVVAPLIGACSKDEDPMAEEDGSCPSTPSETAGPYPTKSPAGLTLTDIRSDREGVSLNVHITIRNKNNSCAVLENATVDIWHCDKDGNYSEYGNSTAVHFLRGRQTTDNSGLVGFTSIFPGWYSGRAPHIHVHVYDSSGKSLLVTQIAFAKAVTDEVYTTSSLYSLRGKQDTTNERDNVFSDGYSNELATVEGNINDGYTLTHTIVVEG